MKKSHLVALFLLLVPSAWAGGQVWITDKLEAQIRKGPGNQYKTIKLLPAGAELKMVDGKQLNGYSHVALASGEEGWIPSRYLISTRPEQAGTEKDPRKQSDLCAENHRLRGDSGSPESNAATADKANDELSAENARLNSELIAIRQASANVLQIQSERDQLTQEKVALENELDSLKREKQSMDANARQDWFMIGAGVLFGGILLGLILPRFGWRKKNSWNSF